MKVHLLGHLEEIDVVVNGLEHFVHSSHLILGDYNTCLITGFLEIVSADSTCVCSVSSQETLEDSLPFIAHLGLNLVDVHLDWVNVGRVLEAGETVAASG